MWKSVNQKLYGGDRRLFKIRKKKEKGKVNQVDVGNKKSKGKTKWPTFRASDKNHNALRTRKRQ